MRTETRYYCEVCDDYYDTAEKARECEARPLAEPPPIGCIFGDHGTGAFYAGITFAVAKHVQSGHRQFLPLWACRDTGMGDSLGDETCGSNSGFSGNLDEGINREHPTFKRLVEWLRTHGAEYGVNEITIWQNGKAVPLGDKP